MERLQLHFWLKEERAYLLRAFFTSSVCEAGTGAGLREWTQMIGLVKAR